MKILCVIDNLGSGGAQRQMVELSKAFVDLAHEVSFLTYHEHDFYQDELEAYGIEITCLIEKNYLRRVLRMRRFIRRGKFDVVLSFLQGSNMICEIAGFPSRKWKLVVGERSSNPRILTSWKLRMYRWFHTFADYVVANSHSNIELVKKANPFLAKRKCHVIYNLVDPILLEEPQTLSKNGNVDIIIGASHRFLKNSSGLVKAIGGLSSRVKSRIEIRWYGDRIEPPYFDESYERTMAMIKHAGVQDLIKFYPATDRFIEEMKKADAVGLFSFHEGFPNVICEGMALGKPVIVSRVSDIPKLLHHDIRQTFDPSSTKEICKAIEYISGQSKEALREIGLKNREVAKNNFAKEEIVNQYLDLMKI